MQHVNAKDTPKEAVRQAVSSFNKIVSAVSFDRKPLPHIMCNRSPLNSDVIQHDDKDGVIVLDKLYSFGTAYFEILVDFDYGHKEPNVGLWKFMEQVRSSLPMQQQLQNVAA